MLNLSEQTLRAAKIHYIHEILFDYEFGRCDSADIIHAVNAVINANADEFNALMILASNPANRYVY